MTPFKIKSYKEPGNEFVTNLDGGYASRMQAQMAFNAIEKELKNNIKYKELVSKSKGEFSIIITFPDKEPWINEVYIESYGYSLEEIWFATKCVSKELSEYYKNDLDFK